MKSELATKRYFRVYGRYMDAALRQKIKDIGPWVRPGVIAEAGFGTGQILKLLTRRFPRSLLYGIDVSSHFFRVGQKRFRGIRNVRLVQGDIVRPVLPLRSVDTKIFSSVLHEVYSYYGYQEKAVARALRVAWRELKDGGRIIIRDGIKPEQQSVYLHFIPEKNIRFFSGNPVVADTETMFLRFAREFKKDEGISYALVRTRNGRRLYKMNASSAYEFLSKKDYRMNWHIEINEQFGVFTLREYSALLRRIGFRIVHARAYHNPWIVKHRWKGKIALYTKDVKGRLRFHSFPPTNTILVAEKPG